MTDETPEPSTMCSPTNRKPNLRRFLDAQAGKGPGQTYDEAFDQMKGGKKQGCWIWYVFPQLIDPERACSVNNRQYQIHSQEEAIAFLKHDMLGSRYLDISRVVSDALKDQSLISIMGWDVDAKKFHQSVTTMYLAACEAQLEEHIKAYKDVLQRLEMTPYKPGVAMLDPDMVSSWKAKAHNSL